MYTLVLMTAVAAGPDATRFDGWGGCYGSACYSSCYGTSCVGCYGSCFGGPVFPRARAFFAGAGERLRGAFAYHPFGCCGGYASCSGCFGTSCSGCFGSSCYGGGVYYGSAVYGGCYGSSSVGCYGGGCVGGGFALPSIPVVPAAAELPAGTMAFKPPEESSAASLTVSLPAAAKLYVDGQLVAGDGPARRFHTPPLEAGRSFYYELKAEVLIGGKTEVEETKVVVRAGDSRDVSFAKLAAAVSGGGSLVAR